MHCLLACFGLKKKQKKTCKTKISLTEESSVTREKETRKSFVFKEVIEIQNIDGRKDDLSSGLFKEKKASEMDGFLLKKSFVSNDVSEDISEMHIIDDINNDASSDASEEHSEMKAFELDSSLLTNVGVPEVVSEGCTSRQNQNQEKSPLYMDAPEHLDKEIVAHPVQYLKERYDVQKVLGLGAFGTVKLCLDTMTKEQVAIKKIEKATCNFMMSNVMKEIDALMNLNHQHICQMYETVETTRYFFIVMEFCAEGNLCDHVKFNRGLPEKEARRIFRQILSALAYIHSMGYVHRDLKLDNVMLNEKKDIKLIDFGLSAKPKGGLNTLLKDQYGTSVYMAPEVLAGKPYLGAPADVWSFGILFYTMLCCKFPFHTNEDNFSLLLTEIMCRPFKIPYFVSPASARLLREMLLVEPHRRITVDQLLNHSWVNKGHKRPVDWHSTFQTEC